MSSYISTYEVGKGHLPVHVACIDDYYGPHRYGYQPIDSKDWDEHDKTKKHYRSIGELMTDLGHKDWSVIEPESSIKEGDYKLSTKGFSAWMKEGISNYYFPKYEDQKPKKKAEVMGYEDWQELGEACGYFEDDDEWDDNHECHECGKEKCKCEDDGTEINGPGRCNGTLIEGSGYKYYCKGCGNLWQSGDEIPRCLKVQSVEYNGHKFFCANSDGIWTLDENGKAKRVEPEYVPGKQPTSGDLKDILESWHDEPEALPFATWSSKETPCIECEMRELEEGIDEYEEYDEDAAEIMKKMLELIKRKGN